MSAFTPKYRKTRQAFIPYVTQAHKDADAIDQPERLTGKVRDMAASAAEERLAAAFQQKGKSFYFRMALGAPRNLPGWKELDFLVQSTGYAYAIEVDSTFTHRLKVESDKLHDAIVLKALEQEGYNVFPHVYHLDGETQLSDAKTTRRTVEELFV